MTTLAALASVAVLLPGLYAFARHVAGHITQSSPHPNGRCPICGLAFQETR